MGNKHSRQGGSKRGFGNIDLAESDQTSCDKSKCQSLKAEKIITVVTSNTPANAMTASIKNHSETSNESVKLVGDGSLEIITKCGSAESVKDHGDDELPFPPTNDAPKEVLGVELHSNLDNDKKSCSQLNMTDRSKSFSSNISLMTVEESTPDSSKHEFTKKNTWTPGVTTSCTDNYELPYWSCGGSIASSFSDTMRYYGILVTEKEDCEDASELQNWTAHRREEVLALQKEKLVKKMAVSFEKGLKDIAHRCDQSPQSIRTNPTVSTTNSFDNSSASSSEPAVFTSQPSLYMRATDIAPRIQHEEQEKIVQNHKHVHLFKAAPNTNLDTVSTEMFIALDSSHNKPSPILHKAMVAFCEESQEFISNATEWVPQSRNCTLYQDDIDRVLMDATDTCNIDPVSLSPQTIDLLSKEILTWTVSSATIPFAIRSLGIIGMSPIELHDLIWDSSRATEYNVFSAGREDLRIIEENDECSTKVVRGKTIVMRKTLPFITFFHGKKCGRISGKDAGEKYMITTRTAKLVDENGLIIDAKSFIGEIKMGTNFIVSIEGHEDKCLFVSAMEAGKSPLPVMISKRIGLSSSSNFINGLRNVGKTKN